jgi:hypothetical protein
MMFLRNLPLTDEMNHKRVLGAGRLPLLVAACVICAIGSINIYRLTSAIAPRNPWESLEVVEAWRSLKGMPVYELPPQGHATHMYGALVPWVQGEIFRWTGPNNLSGRLLSLVSSLLLVTMLAVCFAGERSIWAIVIAWAALLGVDHRSGHYFAENRPDMPALCLGAGALMLFGWGIERRRLTLVVLGTVCLVLGFFFKQTVSIFAAVPLVALILRGRLPGRSDIVLAGIPLVVMGGVIGSLGFFSEAIHHYMIAVPGAYSINWARAVKYLWELLLDSPLFLVLMAELVIFGEGRRSEDRRVRWLLATLAIAIPFGAISHAKVGGWPNSLLPALLAMMAFCVLRVPAIVARLEKRTQTLAGRLGLGTFVAVLLLMTTYPHLTWGNGLVVPRSRWDKDYRETLAVAGGLPGLVVCPEDPTIPFYGNGYVGLSLFSEKDARSNRGKWPIETPEPVLEEMRRAEFVVDVWEYWGENVDDALLESLGFQPMEVKSIDPECYRIWRKANRLMTGVSPVPLDRIGLREDAQPSSHR